MTARRALDRAVSRWELVGLATNSVVGSGVYLLPAAAAALLGPASLWAVLVAGAAVALLVLCFAEAASHFDEPGGSYLYAREAFGAFVGFEVGWMTWLARVGAAASLAAGFAQALAFLWPGAAAGWTRWVAVSLPIVLITGINVVGVRAGARTAVALMVAKILPLLLLVAVGVFAIDADALRSAGVPAAGALGEAALLLLFAYSGFEVTAAAAGEYRNPRRDVPFALVTMIVAVTALYFLIQMVALGTVPDLARQADGAGLAVAADRLLGSWGGVILTAGATVSILGTIGGAILMGPRYLFALAEDGYGPRGLTRVHPRFHTPDAAILVQGALGLALALSGSFVQLALLSMIARLATYIGTAAAVPILRRKLPVSEQTLRLPGGPLIPLSALALCVVFLASTSAWNLAAGAIALAGGGAIYAFRREPAPAAALSVSSTP